MWIIDTRPMIFHQVTSCLCTGIFNTFAVFALLVWLHSYLQSYYVFLFCSSMLAFPYFSQIEEQMAPKYIRLPRKISNLLHVKY